jgi:mRNA interferase MazF
MMTIKRGSIWLANLDPTVGSEIRKTRPVVVVSNDTNNLNNTVVTVLPITSNITHVYSFEVLLPKGIGSLPKDSKAKADQVRTLDKTRLVKILGTLPNNYIELIEAAIKLHLGLK